MVCGSNGLGHSRNGGNLVAFVFETEKRKGNDTGLLPPTKAFEGRLCTGATVVCGANGLRCFPFKGKVGIGSKGRLGHSREGGNLVAFVFKIEKRKGKDAGLLPPTKAFEGRLCAGATVIGGAVGFRSFSFEGKVGMGSKGGLGHSREGGNLVTFVFETEKLKGKDAGLLPAQERRQSHEQIYFGGSKQLLCMQLPGWLEPILTAAAHWLLLLLW